MAKRVNSWNEWDPLRRVILGRPEGTNIPAPNPSWSHHIPEGGFPLGSYGPFPQEQVELATQQMDNFAAELERRGIVVDRIEIHPAMLDGRAISTPDWTQVNQHGAAPVRDEFITVGNEIVEATGSRRERWFEYLNLRPIFERYFKEDPDFLWSAAPKPRLTDESFVKNYFYNFYEVWDDAERDRRMRNWEFRCTEKEPLWSGADAQRAGADIFWMGSSTTNRSGMDWVKRYFGARGVRVHAVLFEGDQHPWHIDSDMQLLRPGLAMLSPEKPPITPECLQLLRDNDWEVVHAAPPVHVHRYKVRLYERYNTAFWTSMNTLMLDPKTICVEAHETAYQEQLDKLGFDVVPIEYDAVIPFGGSFHCTTLDVHREGALQDYFPNQVPGF